MPYRRIVGVVADTALIDLDQPPPAIIFELNEHSGDTYLSYIVRTNGDPLATVGAAREILHSLDPQLPLIQPRTFDQVAQQAPSVFLRSYPSLLIGSFAGLALILAVIGLYGVISYSVMQRTREIGIRVAMGAQRPDVLRLVLREALTTSATGVLVGVVCGLFLTRLMSSLLYGVTPGDWLTFLPFRSCALRIRSRLRHPGNPRHPRRPSRRPPLRVARTLRADERAASQRIRSGLCALCELCGESLHVATK